MKIVETAIANARLTISVLLFLMLAGAMAYVSIPKEAEPDIQIPILYVSMHYDGISPEDSERLLLRPMETSLKSITGIKKMTSTAFQGGGNVLIEFQAGADLKKALTTVLPHAYSGLLDPAHCIEDDFHDFLMADRLLFYVGPMDCPTRAAEQKLTVPRSRRGKPMSGVPEDLISALQALVAPPEQPEAEPA